MFRNYDDVMRTAKPESADSEEDSQDSSLHICGICTDGWLSETEVVIHQGMKHKNYIKQLYSRGDEKLCKICLREFKDNNNLLGHIKSAHLLSSETAIRVEREIFVCDICSSIFFNKMMLEYHIIFTHTPKKEWGMFKCPVCLRNTKVSTSWYHFRGHRLQSIACCKICFKKFRDLKRLAEHLKVHTPLYKCDTCAYETKKEDLLTQHIQSTHKRHNQQVADRPIDLDRYFIVPSNPKRLIPLSLMGWRGVKLTNGVNVCVLCREICVGEESKKQHILLDHMDRRTVVVHYLCSCGMLFTNKLLLRHHRFKFKDLHTD